MGDETNGASTRQDGMSPVTFDGCFGWFHATARRTRGRYRGGGVPGAEKRRRDGASFVAAAGQRMFRGRATRPCGSIIPAPAIPATSRAPNTGRSGSGAFTPRPTGCAPIAGFSASCCAGCGWARRSSRRSPASAPTWPDSSCWSRCCVAGPICASLRWRQTCSPAAASRDGLELHELQLSAETVRLVGEVDLRRVVLPPRLSGRGVCRGRPRLSCRVRRRPGGRAVPRWSARVLPGWRRCFAPAS